MSAVKRVCTIVISDYCNCHDAKVHKDLSILSKFFIIHCALCNSPL